MSSSRASDFLRQFTRDLKARDAFPRNVRVAACGPISICSVYDLEPQGAISEDVFSGMDLSPDVAVLKGLVEYIETKAFQAGARSGLRSCMTERSDGFAAFPEGTGDNARERARTNAHNEATERYVWSQWWDDPGIAAEVIDVSSDRTSAAGLLLGELEKHLPVRSVLRVRPRYESADGSEVVIFLAFVNSLGVISGGACDRDAAVASFRAVCEMLRHGLALKKMDSLTEPLSFYERRLAFFGRSADGEALVHARLASSSNRIISLPSLSIDEAVPHVYEDLVRVHRCLFENQPPFVGGDLERLCL